MGNAVVDWIFRRPKFCCCLPVRAAVVVISLFTILVSALIALVSWFEVATYKDIWGPLKDAYIGAGVVYTLLFLAAAIGFIGAVVRKQLFVTIFSYALYAHILVNAGLAGYVLWMVNHAKQVDLEKLCDTGFHNSGTATQCTDVLKITDAVVFVIAFIILGVELYWAIVITRYVHQIKSEKLSVRDSRLMARQERSSAAFSLLPPKDGKLDQPFDSDAYRVGADGADDAFDPYRPYDTTDPFERSSRIPSREIDLASGYGYGNGGYRGAEREQSEAEQGYGGGAWRYSSVVQAEKDPNGRRGANATESTLVDGPLPVPVRGDSASVYSQNDQEQDEGERTPTGIPPLDPPPSMPASSTLRPSTPPFISRPLSHHMRGGTGSESNASASEYGGGYQGGNGNGVTPSLPAYSFVERPRGAASPSA